MKISLKWLARYIDTAPMQKDLKTVLSKLTLRGLEVETVSDLSKGFDKVVVGQIETRDKHPNADRLSVCKVNTGVEVLQIVCGAQNMKASDKVAVSLVGAHLPNGLKIEKGKIRDVESFGMLCSEVELGLAETSEGILILPSDAQVGKPLAEFLGRNDTVFEINVTPNRGDALSHLGVARELAAILGQNHILEKKLKTLQDKASKVVEEFKNKKVIEEKVQIINSSDHCLQYHAIIIKNVKVGPSPKKLKEDLTSVGLRSINNIVDVTNYILMDMGQPLHAFDYSKIAGGKINIRLAKTGEKMLLLNGITVSLVADDLVIADSENPVALAGVMGGGNSEVTEKTVSILLEAAQFSPATVRKTAKRLALHSDSSHRFERGIDSKAVVGAMNQAISLMLGFPDKTTYNEEFLENIINEDNESKNIEIEKKQTESIKTEKKQTDKSGHTISFDLASCNQSLGLNLSEKEIEETLKSIGFNLVNSAKGTLTYSVPSYRNEVEIKEDLFEEILRVWGYDKVEAAVPQMHFIPDPINEVDLKARKVERLKNSFTGFGFSEAINFGFTSAVKNSFWGGSLASKAVTLQNPLNEEFGTMKTSLVGGLFENAILAFSHQQKDLRLFEVRKIYSLDPNSETGVQESWMVAGILTGRSFSHSLAARDRDLDFYDLKGFIESAFESIGCRGYRYQSLPNSDARLHPAQSTGIAIGKGLNGFMGRLHPKIEAEHKIRQPVYLFEFSLDAALSVSSGQKKFSAISKFPKVDRDLSLIVPEGVSVDKILSTIQKIGKPLMERIEIIDLYTGEKVPANTKSITISFTLSDAARTLEDKEVEAFSDKVLTTLDREHSIKLRLQ